MSVAEGVTTAGTGTLTVWVDAPDYAIPNARGAVRCEVNEKGELELYPNDALGAYFLHHFGHGRVAATWVLRPDGAYTATSPPLRLSKLVLHHEAHPLLSSGGDPFYTGVPLSPAELKACLALVDQMRDKKPKGKARRRPVSAPPEKGSAADTIGEAG